MLNTLLDMPLDTSLPQDCLSLMAEARARYGPNVVVSTGLIALSDESLWVVIGKVVVDGGFVEHFHPVLRDPSAKGVLSLQQARNEAISHMLSLMVAGVPVVPVEPEVAPQKVLLMPPVVGEQVGSGQVVFGQVDPAKLEVADSASTLCEDCHQPIRPYTTGTHTVLLEDLIQFTVERYGAVLCPDCSTKRYKNRSSN